MKAGHIKLINMMIEKTEIEQYIHYLKQQTQKVFQTQDASLITNYRLLGKRIRIRHTSIKLMEQFAIPLAHRQIDVEGQADFTIDVWDSHTSKVTFSKPYSFLEYDHIYDLDVNQSNILFWYDNQSLILFDQANNHAIWAMSDYRLLISHMFTSPFLVLFNLWGLKQGATIVHSAAIGKNNQGALLVGPSGSGKSTTSLICLRDGFQFIGEDYCIVHSEECYVENVYNTGKLTEWSAQHLPELLEHTWFAAGEVNEKTIMSFYPHYQSQLIDRIPLKVIILPKVTSNRETTWQKISPALGLQAMAPSTIFQLQITSGRKQFKWMADLARKIPSYNLLLGTDINQVSSTISDLLDHVGTVS